MTRTTLLIVLLAITGGREAAAADPDNCLLCHQYRGMTRYDAEEDRVHVFFVDPNYSHNMEGPHARLTCTQCHPRDEVAVIPHKPVSRVNCTQTCHLESTGDVARRFSHANVAEMLDRSAHDFETLNELAFAGGPLKAEDQSNCLYCHDEPVFRSAEPTLLSIHQVSNRTFDRCDVCHEERIPLDVAYYLRHVVSRTEPARPPLVEAQVCAVCHVDPQIMADYDMSNAVASYVRSFHGKAALLGYDDTADCLACHVDRGDNAHLMFVKENPQSAVHPNNVANTCRSTECHPGADVALASTGVHLNLPEATGTVEFWVAFGFIVLTIFSFGPSLVMALMELLHIVIGYGHSHGHRMHKLTEKVLQTPGGRERLKRFTVSQRWQHWILAGLFIVLVLTGFPMKFADDQWARGMINFFGGLPTARDIHHWCGIALVIGFAAHFMYAIATFIKLKRNAKPSGEKRSLMEAVFALPMIIKPSDLVKANQYMMYLFGLRKQPPTFGRFSIKEKFEYIGVFWGTTLLGATGLILWAESFFSHYVTGRVFNIALIAHTYEAFLAVIHVGILHIVNVSLSPHVFPLSPATITGDTPTAELAEQHSEFVEEAAADLGIKESRGDHE